MILHIMISIPTKILELNFPGKMDLPNLCSSETYIYFSCLCGFRLLSVESSSNSKCVTERFGEPYNNSLLPHSLPERCILSAENVLFCVKLTYIQLTSLCPGQELAVLRTNRMAPVNHILLKLCF